MTIFQESVFVLQNNKKFQNNLALIGSESETTRVGKTWLPCHDHTMIMAKHDHDHAMMTAMFLGMVVMIHGMIMA